MKYFLQKLTKQMLVVVILTVMASGSVWTYAAFVEPTVTPANYNQDFTQNIMGANNADNDFDSSTVVADNDGSLIERIEYIIDALAALWTKSGDDLYYTTGNIGIGTTGPGGLLHIANGLAGAEPTYRGNLIIESGQIDAASNGIEFKSSTGGSGYGYRLATIYPGTGMDFRIQSRQNSASWTDRLTINTAGNVGIGTTEPGELLDVAGNIAVGLDGQNNYIDSLGQLFIRANTNDDAGYNGLKLQAGSGTYGTITFDTAGSEQMRITSSGNVGIGTTSPGAKLTVIAGDFGTGKVNTLGNFSYTSSINGNRQILLQQWGTTTTAEQYIIGNGYLSGTTSAVANNGPYTEFQGIKFDGATEGFIYNSSNIPTYALAVDTTSGNVGIGITNPTYKLQLNGQPAANGYTAWTNYSDRRLKDNITDIDYGSDILSKISQLHPVSFNYNELTGYDEETRSRRISGFIAQELQPIFPQMVATTTINGTEYLDTNLSDLPLYLVEGMKELLDKVEVLEKEVESLKNQ